MQSIQNHLFKVMMLAGLVSSFGVTSVFAQDWPRLTYCSECDSDLQWEYAAEQDSLMEWDRVSGTDQVYVLNVDNLQVRAYSVQRWYEEKEVDARLMNSAYQESIEAMNRKEGPSSHVESGLGFYYAEATRVDADPVLHHAILDAFAAIDEYLSLSGNINWLDLGLPDRISSSVDLIGQDNGPAGYNRGMLKNIANQYLIDSYSRFYLGAGDAKKYYMNRILLDSGFKSSRVTVEFKDSSRIQLKIIELSAILFSEKAFSPRLKVLIETARGQGFAAVPQSMGHFNGFSYAGNPITVQAMANLAERFGISVTLPDDGPPAEIACADEGGVLICNVSATLPVD